MFHILFLLVFLGLTSMVRSTGIIVPLYAYPGTDAWNTVYESIAAYPSIPFYLVINPATGPGTTEYPEEAYITAIAKLNSYSNVQVLGYTYTNHGSRAISEVEADIAIYAKWSSYTSKDISLAGIFFDLTPNGKDQSQLPYFEKLSSTARNSDLATVVFNPGVKILADVTKWFAAADFIVEFENTYTYWLASAPSEHLSEKASYAKDVVILNQTPADTSIDAVVKLAKDMGLGAIYVTDDDKYLALTSVSKIAVAVSQRKVRRGSHDRP